MTECPTCQTQLPENHPALNLEKLLNWVEARGGWYIFEDGYSVGHRFEIPNTPGARIAAIKPTYDSGDVDIEAYYGESALPQGSEFQTYVVIEIDGAYFKKTGRGDSYGEVTWDGDVRTVTAQVKTIEVFE